MPNDLRASADQIRLAYGDPALAGQILQRLLAELPGGELDTAIAYAGRETDPAIAFHAFVRGLLIGHPERLPTRPSVNWQYELVGELIERCGRERPAAVDSKPSDPITRALTELFQHPEWTNARIAKAAGVSRETLSRSPKFLKARDALRAGRKAFKPGNRSDE